LEIFAQKGFSIQFLIRWAHQKSLKLTTVKQRIRIYVRSSEFERAIANSNLYRDPIGRDGY